MTQIPQIFYRLADIYPRNQRNLREMRIAIESDLSAMQAGTASTLLVSLAPHQPELIACLALLASRSHASETLGETPQRAIRGIAKAMCHLIKRLIGIGSDVGPNLTKAELMQQLDQGYAQFELYRGRQIIRIDMKRLTNLRN